MSDTIDAKATEREPSDRVSSFKKSLEELAEKVGVPRDRIPVEKKSKKTFPNVAGILRHTSIK